MKKKFETKVIHEGQVPEKEFGSVSKPIYQTSTFKQDEFGQYTYDKKNGIKPKNRDKDKKFFVKKFSNLSDSVRSYLKNINTHRAYETFRLERKRLMCW